MDYQLKAVGKTCSKSGKEFLPGDTCYSAVLLKGNEWVRIDFCSEAWTGPPSGAIGYWKCLIPARAQVQRNPLDPDVLLRQFEQLSEEASPAQEKLRYVLALLLVQRRRLRVNCTRAEGGTTVLELVGSQGEGPYEVRDQQLDAQEAEALERQLNPRVTINSFPE